MAEQEFSVELEAICPVAEDQALDLMEVLDMLGAGGPVVSFTDRSVRVRFNVEDAHVTTAVVRAVELFAAATEKIGLKAERIDRAEAMTVEALDHELMQPAPRLVGVSEIAQILDVSRQRVSELRTREDFPAPIVELAAGPVWNETMLQLFLAGWDRKPGRPRKVTA